MRLRLCWRYVYGGRRRHLVEDKRGYFSRKALCGLEVLRQEWWLSANAARFQPCERCEEVWARSSRSTPEAPA